MSRNNFLRVVQKIIVGCSMVLVLSCCTLNAPTAHAQAVGPGQPTFDAANFIKNSLSAVYNGLIKVSSAATAANTGVSATGITALVTKGYALDPLAWSVAKIALNSLVQSTVRWINSGFNGSPAFVTNLQNTLLSAANANAHVFIQQLTTNGSIKSPFQNAVAAAVGSSYNKTTNGGFFVANPYTLNKTTQNDAAFFNGNFVQGGGLSTWAAAWSSTANNPFGATLLAQDALNSSNAAAVGNQSSEIQQNNGFLSYKGSCNSKVVTANGSLSTSLANLNKCIFANVLTPGSVIANSLYKSLGSSVDQLVTANQLGDIVNALMGQLLNQVLGSGGLAGTSRPSSSGGSSYLDQIGSTNTGTTGGLTSSFNQTLSGQLTSLQSFLTEWQTIDTAALAAQSALQTSSCPGAPQVGATIVQPVLTQAATEISKAQTSITAIQKLQTETSSASTANSTAGLSQAASDFATLQSSPNLPTLADIQYAQAQSVDSGTNQPITLYTQMNNIAQNPNDCTAISQTQS